MLYFKMIHIFASDSKLFKQLKKKHQNLGTLMLACVTDPVVDLESQVSLTSDRPR